MPIIFFWQTWLQTGLFYGLNAAPSVLDVMYYQPCDRYVLIAFAAPALWEDK